MSQLNRVLPWVAFLVLASSLAACGGGGDSSGANPPPPPPPPPASQNPTASFVAPATGAANVPLTFDASASASADGSALATYSWDFGNGSRAGGRTVAQLFTSGGRYEVKLTVADAQGRTASLTRTLDITPPAAAPRTQTISGSVKTVAGAALSGVTVTVVGASTTATSDADGKLNIDVGVDVATTLKFSKAGYADQHVPVRIPATAGADTHVEARMSTREAAQSLDATSGGTLAGKDGATIVLPANALILPSGAAASGTAQIAMTPVNVTLPRAGGFPGSFIGTNSDATSTPIVSFGTTEFSLSSGGQPLQLAPGRQASVELPMYANQQLDGTAIAVGNTLPLWSLDERSGMWINEGSGTVVASTASPTGMALRATVTHFSWWNIDIGFPPYRPQPKCVYDTDIGLPGGEDYFATATICNMLGEIDRGPESPTGASVQAQIATTAPGTLPGYAASITIPIAGGVPLPVPAGVNVILSANTFNGTWTGRTVVNGPVNGAGEVLIKMRPINNSGQGESITLPYDQVSSLNTGQTALYNFHSVANKWVRVTITRGSSSNLNGRVRLLRDGAELAAANFSSFTGQLTYNLPAGGQLYTVEVTGTANTPGAYRLQVELLGGTQDEVLTLPADVTRTLPAFTTYRGSLTVGQRTVLSVVFGRSGGIAPLALRVRSATGALVSQLEVPGNQFRQAVTLQLPEPGTYSFDAAATDGAAAAIRMTAEPTSWLPLENAFLPADSDHDLVDLIADRNGAPVIVQARSFAQAGIFMGSIALQRWSGTAWVDAAPAVPDYPRPCAGSGSIIAAAFDSSNAPVVAYALQSATGQPDTYVLRYDGTAWRGVGAADGKLPKTSQFSSTCNSLLALRIGADDRPAIAYQVDDQVWVLRFDGTQWTGFANQGGDSFAAINPSYDLQFSPGGQPYLALSISEVATVRRFNTTNSQWEPVGPNNGVLPVPSGTNGYFRPRLRFDGGGAPWIGSLSSVITSPGVYTTGVAVLRYDGAAWQTSGGFRLNSSSYANGPTSMGFTLFDGAAIMGYVNQTGSITSPVVFRSTATNWSPLGLEPNGAITQYYAHGITDSTGYTLRPLAIGNVLYLALVESPSFGTTKWIRLLRYTP